MRISSWARMRIWVVPGVVAVSLAAISPVASDAATGARGSAATAVVAGTGRGPLADTVLLDGRILLFTPRRDRPKRWVDAMAVSRGVVTYLGSNRGARQLIGSRTRVVDLDGRMVMPGLGDGHLHGPTYTACNLGYEGGTVEQVLGKLKDCLLRDDQLGYLDSNYQLAAFYLNAEAMVPAGAQLDRHILDRLSATPAADEYGTGTTRPIVVRNSDFHKLYTNSIAIANGGVTAETDPDGGYIGIGDDGLPNGIFSEFRADWGPMPEQPADAELRAKADNISIANSMGITMFEVPHSDRGGSREQALLEWSQLADGGQLTAHVNQTLRVTADVRGVTEAAELDQLLADLDDLRTRYDGYSSAASPGDLTFDTVKIHCDGVAEYPAQTAAMLQPYRENVGTPEAPVWQPTTNRGEDPSCEDSVTAFSALDADRWNIHVHAIGDRAARIALDNISQVTAENSTWDRRHTLAHLQFVNRSDVSRFARLGVVANMSLQWAQRDAYSVDAVEGYVAPDVTSRMYPAGELVRSGAVVAAGSDWPVDPLNPWRQIETAVTRSGDPDPAAGVYEGRLAPAQALGLLDAIRASTLNVAYQLHLNDETGSLRVGKQADLIVLDRNLFQIPAKDISETEVLMTMLGGQVVWGGAP